MDEQDNKQETNLSAEAIRQKTKEIFGKDDIDYSYTTDETIAADAALGQEFEVSAEDRTVTWYGNNGRYGTRTMNGQTWQVYYFENNSNQIADWANSCGTNYTWWARMDLWHHAYIDTCPNRRERWSFTQ